MADTMKRAWAQAKNNGDFLCIETYSSCGLHVCDPQGKQHLLSPDASEGEIGVAVLDCLAYSRWVMPLEDKDLWDYKLNELRYSTWITKMMATYGYKTKRALFKNMKSCSIERNDGLITIHPSNHDRLEGWSGNMIRDEDSVIISADCAPGEIGAGLRLAFSRCI
jgi:CDI immunity protein